MSEFTDRIQPTNSGLATYIDDLKSGKYQIPTLNEDFCVKYLFFSMTRMMLTSLLMP